MIAFIDDHRGVHGVEPICEVLPIAPSTCHAHAARRVGPAKCSARARRDAALMPSIERVVDWFNHRRLLEPIGNVPPAEAEDHYYAMLQHPPLAA